MIRWSKSDAVKLGKAVAQFNKEIKKNETITNKLILPEPVSYKDLKNSIQTREGLNYYIRSLKRIKLPRGFYY